METLTRLFWFMTSYLGYVRATVLYNNYGHGRAVGSKVTFRLKREKTGMYGEKSCGQRFVIFSKNQSQSNRIIRRDEVQAMHSNAWPDLFRDQGFSGQTYVNDPHQGDAVLFQFTDTSMAGIVYNGRRWVGMELPPEVANFWIGREKWDGCITFRNQTNVLLPGVPALSGLALTPAIVVDYFAGRISLGELLEFERRGRQAERLDQYRDKLTIALDNLRKVRDSVSSRTNAEAVHLVEEARQIISQSIG